MRIRRFDDYEEQIKEKKYPEIIDAHMAVLADFRLDGLEIDDIKKIRESHFSKNNPHYYVLEMISPDQFSFGCKCGKHIYIYDEGEFNEYKVSDFAHLKGIYYILEENDNDENLKKFLMILKKSKDDKKLEKYISKNNVFREFEDRNFA